MSDYGRYRLLAPIGRGRITEAFKAKSFGVEGFEKTLVIKRFRPELFQDPERLAPLLAAANQSMRLSHANVAQVFDIGEVLLEGQKSHYLATEYVPGLSLESLLDRSRAAGIEFPSDALLFLATEICKALDHAHRCLDEHAAPLGVVHGALTSGNVLVSWEGEIKVSDFGLLRALTKAGSETTAQADLEALGKLLAALLPRPGPFQELVLALGSPSGAGRFESAAQLYEALMERAYAVRAQLTAEVLAEFAERFRVTALSDAPPRFEGVLDQRVESLPPARPQLSSESLASAPGQAIVAVSLRFGDGDESAAVQDIALAWLREHEAQVASQSKREIEAFWSLAQDSMLGVTLATRCALEILSRGNKLDPTLSVGLEIGNVQFQGDRLADDAARRGVFASTRALSLSLPGRLSVSALVAETLQPWFELELFEPEAGVWLVGQLRPLHSATRFVGRKNELANLGTRLVSAVRGTPQPVAIVGEGGIGKSRLLREMRRRLKKGTVKLGFYLVNCRTDSSNVPYAALSDMLRKLCGVREHEVGGWIAVVQPRLRALGLSEEEIQSLLIALGAKPAGATQFSPVLLEAGVAKMLHSLSLEKPHLFAFDRAEHLDVASAEILARIVPRLKQARTLIVFAGRADNVGFLRQIPGYSELPLSPLATADVARLVQYGTGVTSIPTELVDFIVAQSGGHPMVAIELLREGIEQGSIRPESDQSVHFAELDPLREARSLAELLEQRLRALSREELSVLTAVAVLDEPVELAHIAGVTTLLLLDVHSVVDDLEVRGLLQRLSPTSVALAVQVLAEVVAQIAEPSEWRELHARAAGVYEKSGNEFHPEDTRRVAQHLEAAGKRDQARAAYGKSGVRLLEQGLFQRAARHLGRALLLTNSESPLEEVATWVSGLARCAPQASFPDLLPAMVAAAELLITAGSDAEIQRLAAVMDAAQVLAEVHRFREAEDLLQAALAKTASFPKLARRGLTLEASIAAQRGEFPHAVRALDRSADLGSGSIEEQHRHLVTLAQALAGAGESARAMQSLAEADGIGAKLGPREACGRARARSFLHACQGDYKASAKAAARAAELATHAGQTLELAQALHDETVAWLLANDLPKCYATCKRASEVAAQIGSDRLVNLNQWCLTFLDGQRNAVAAERPLRQALADAEGQGWTSDILLVRYLLGQLLIQNAEVERGTLELKAGLKLALSVGNQHWVRVCGHAIASN